jgi:hypothetical protein
MKLNQFMEIEQIEELMNKQKNKRDYGRLLAWFFQFLPQNIVSLFHIHHTSRGRAFTAGTGGAI